jgi:hypothetical protein
MKPVPLLGNGVFGKSAVVTSQRRVNCYVEKRGDQDKSEIAVYQTPGLTLFTNAGVGPIRAMRSMPNLGLMFVVSGSYLYAINNAGTVTNFWGPIAAGTTPVGICDNGIEVIVVDGVNGYIYNTTTNTFGQIVDANFPNGAFTVAFNDGYFIVDDPAHPGRFYLSANVYTTANAGLTWTPVQFATAQSNPDGLVAVDELHGLVLMFGSQSIEYWQDVGASPFPYQPIVSATQDWGLAARWSRAYIGNTLCFLGQTQQGQVQVMEMQGFVPKVISTPDVDAVINGFTVVNDAVALSYVTDGHFMYQLTFPTQGRSFLYDITQREWSETQSQVALQARHTGQLSVQLFGKVYIGDYSTGNIYLLDKSNYTDNGVQVPRIIQTRHVYDSYDVLGVDEVFLDMETGVGLQSGQGSNPQIMMEISKDGGRTFPVQRWSTFGLVGQYKFPRAIWRRVGSGYDFVFRFTVTDPVKFVISGSGATVRKAMPQRAA